jgi:hypothetical protein
MDGNDLANPVKYLFGEEFFTVGGFTKRELIAAMAMQGMLAGCPIYDPNGVARTAVAYADALIERLSADPVAEGLNLLPMYSPELDEGLADDK